MVKFRFVKKVLRIIALILPCFLFCFLFAPSSYATDPSYTLNSWSSAFTLCDDSDPSSSVLNIKCSDYHYVTLTSHGYISSNRNNHLDHSFYKSGLGYSFSWYVYFFTDFTIDSSSFSKISINNMTGDLTSSRYVTYTFSNSYPGSVSPSGSLSITSNGTYDVTSYAQAVVDVPPIPGDYHDDIMSVRDSIIIISAVIIFVLFIFYLYRLFIVGGIFR